MEEHQKAMDKVKELLVSPMIRTHFDPKLPTILECDSARRKGMGYALMQKHGEDYKLVDPLNHLNLLELIFLLFVEKNTLLT